MLVVCVACSFHQVLSETSSSKVGSYRLFSFCSRQSPEMKQSGLGRYCNALLLRQPYDTTEWEARVQLREFLSREDIFINGNDTE